MCIRDRSIGGTVLECDSLCITVNGESTVLPQKEFMLLYKICLLYTSCY